MKKCIMILVSIFMLLAIVACGSKNPTFIVCSGELVTNEYTEVNGNKLTIKNIYILNANKKVDFYTHGGSDKKIVITTQQEVFDTLKVKESNNEIIISGSLLSSYDTDSIKIEAYGYRFDEINLENAVGEINGATTNKEFELNLSGASNIKLSEINGNEFEASLSGASLLTLSNITYSDVELNLSGESRINCINCEIVDAELNLSGASTGTMYLVGTSCEASLSGASSLTLNGNGEKLEIEASGGSSVEASFYTVKKCSAHLSGASTTKVIVSDELMYNLSGASYLEYSGSPSITGKNISGGSEAKQTEEPRYY